MQLQKWYGLLDGVSCSQELLLPHEFDVVVFEYVLNQFTLVPNNYDHPVNSGRTYCFKNPNDQRLTFEGHENLGFVAAHAFARAGRQNDGDRLVRALRTSLG
jgi:hypothetical protein